MRWKSYVLKSIHFIIEVIIEVRVLCFAIRFSPSTLWCCPVRFTVEKMRGLYPF